MSVTLEHIWKQIRTLPREEQVILAERVFADQPDEAFDAACIDLARARAARLDRGETSTIPAAEVFSEYGIED